jgi:phosphoglycolate phosphatase
VSSARFDAVVFDLDGTLIDSLLDLAASVNYTRQSLGLDVLRTQRISTYVGDGATMLIRRALGEGLSETDIQKALNIFMNHYQGHLLDHTKLYPGVDETLSSLAPLKLAVLTNKPLAPSRIILQSLGILDRFLAVFGGTCFEQKKPHPMGLEQILRNFGVSGERTLMVGDSSIDIETGINAATLTCGVTYGFSSYTLNSVKADFLIDDFRQIPEIVFQ